MSNANHLTNPSPVDEDDSISTETLLLIIFGTILVASSLFTLIGALRMVFMPVAIITAIAMIWVLGNKKEKELKARAEQGDPQSQYELGRKYLKRKKTSEAAQLFEPAAQKGHAMSQYELALLYKEGNGVERNLLQAFHWFGQVANQQHAEAQYELGLLYKGNGELLQALYWFGKADEQGHAEARKEHTEARKKQEKIQWEQNIRTGAIPYRTELGRIEEIIAQCIKNYAEFEEKFELLQRWVRTPNSHSDFNRLADQAFYRYGCYPTDAVTRHELVRFPYTDAEKLEKIWEIHRREILLEYPEKVPVLIHNTNVCKESYQNYKRIQERFNR